MQIYNAENKSQSLFRLNLNKDIKCLIISVLKLNWVDIHGIRPSRNACFSIPLGGSMEAKKTLKKQDHPIETSKRNT